MTTDKPIKCASRGFTSKPFFLIQHYELEKRFVASFQDKKKIIQFLCLFIDRSKDELQVKVYNVEDSENPQEYGGTVKKVKLKDALYKWAEVVCHHGNHDLMIRYPETGDYILFDEHGMIFIYTQEDYTSILEGLGLIYKPEEALICEFDHWHYMSAYGQQNLKSFINELELK